MLIVKSMRCFVVVIEPLHVVSFLIVQFIYLTVRMTMWCGCQLADKYAAHGVYSRWSLVSGFYHIYVHWTISYKN